MKIVDKTFVYNLINQQKKEAKEFLSSTTNTEEEQSEIVGDMFLGSGDISDKIERMIKDGEVKLSDELDIDTIRHMRVDALADIIYKPNYPLILKNDNN